MLKLMFKSKFLSRQSKLRMYTVLIRPITLCTGEAQAWSTIKDDEKNW